ncbi:unnamed protein product [Closterium sp. Naga37s-1]|nr:unnamed protein product [Closterium sp. Naga37s-1]
MALAAAGSVAVAQMLSSSGLRPQSLSLGQQQQQLLFSPQIATSTSFTATPRGSRVVAVRAKDGGSQRAIFGTQFFKKRAQEEEEEEEEVNNGTQVFRNFFSPRPAVQEDDEEEDAAPQQTRKFAVPEEIPAAPQGLFGLVKLPFAALIRGRPADRKTVFVAGATGLTGARVVVELLSAGLSVRAGVEDLSDAQQLAELAAKYKVITGEEAKRLNFVEYSASDSEFTAKSIANAGTVVVTLGAGENGPSGNLEVEEALSLARAAILANAPAFVLVSDFAAAPAGVAVKSKSGGGGGGGGLIAAILNFFRSLGGKKGEAATYSGLLTELVEADALDYTVLRVGKFEADSSAYRTNLVVGEEGSIAAGSVARVQVAQVIATIAANPGLAANKVVDLVAAADAEAADIAELLAEVPEDPRRATKKEAAERAAAEEQQKQMRLLASAEAEAAAEEARRAAESAAALEAQAKALAAEEVRAAAAAAKAAARAEAASSTVTSIESNLKEAGASIPPPSAKPAASAAAPAAAFSAPSLPSFGDFAKKIPTPDLGAAASSFTAAASAAAAKATGGTEKAVAAPADAPKQRRPLRQRQSKPAAAAAPAAPAAPKPVEKRKVLGGLLTQETVYVDEDAGDY